MIISGTLRGFKEEDLIRFGSPIDGIQLQLKRDVLCEGFYEHYGYDLTEGTDLFFDVFSLDWFFERNLVKFKSECKSVMIDGNENDLPINGNLVYDLVRSSKATEIILNGDYLNSIKHLKVDGSLCCLVGNSKVMLKSNKIKFY